MISPYDTYTSPLATRNASPEMLRLWSARHKFNTWRRIWLAVAEAQHELGLPVSKEQVEELRAVVNRPGGITDAEIRAAEKYERDLRHDVMAHVHALGDSCPKAKGIIHLGMTSQDVVCNADLLTLRESQQLIEAKIGRVILSLLESAGRTKTLPCLGFTHYQPAQPTTVGRRLACWASDCLHALERIEQYHIRPRGLQGATGTQASFLALFGGNAKAVDDLDAEVRLALFFPHLKLRYTEDRNEIIARERERAREEKGLLADRPDRWNVGFRRYLEESVAFFETAADDKVLQRAIRRDTMHSSHFLTGQTYPRVIDAFILSDLAATASVLHKIATDIRLLCNHKELDEPFETNQIGSSAMPYKRNPMRCERICGLARFVMNLVGNAYDTAATQWLERTLDDSANRRLSLPEAFLALDGALDLMHNVASGLIVHEAMVRKNLMAELPFMATENILMACVKAGGDRQHYHELIRVHAQAAGSRVKDEGLDNDLLERLQKDSAFHTPALKTELDWSGLLDPMKYIGRSIEQTERFIAEVVEPLRTQYADAIAKLDSTGPRV